MTSDKPREDIWADWSDLVNMTPRELREWLETDESRAVGAKKDGDESVGHRSGRRIVEIKETRKGDLTDEQWAHMARVVGYIKRHCAQTPKSGIETSAWRYSLMNWGHDPLRDGGCA